MKQKKRLRLTRVQLKLKMNKLIKLVERFRTQIAIGIVLLFGVSATISILVLSGVTRRAGSEAPTATSTTEVLEISRVPRRLDGILVSSEEANLAPWAVMIENHPDSRPLSGLSQASVVIEAPVEGGITRFIALYPATSTYSEIGPVRSARPYFVDWADGWNAPYFHVGGSPEALGKIASLVSFADVNEFTYGSSFWRDRRRFAPHNTYTNGELMQAIVSRTGVASSTLPIAWHFQDSVTSTDRGDVKSISVPYGGTFNVIWIYDAERGVYQRKQAGVFQKDRDGSPVEAENIIVLKSESQVLDSVGRLRLRTVGSGEALAYRDGKKIPIRWSRSVGEVIRFEGDGGSEFLLTRGRTWIEVVTDDRIFGGLGITTP